MLGFRPRAAAVAPSVTVIKDYWHELPSLSLQKDVFFAIWPNDLPPFVSAHAVKAPLTEPSSHPVTASFLSVPLQTSPGRSFAENEPSF